MPFTISHAAAAMPFRRTRLVMSALIIGCMAPDFEYFLHAGMFGRESHNVRGAFLFALPATLIALAAFHTVLKRPLAALLPQTVQDRIVFHEFRFWPLNRLMLIVLSSIIGIATHFIWDSFTHPGWWIVDHFSWFRQTSTLLGRHVLNSKIVQLVSTLVGLALLLLWFIDWYRHQPRHSDPQYTLSPFMKSAIIVVMTTIAFVFGYWRAHAIVGKWIFSNFFIENAVIAFISVAVLELLVFSVAMRLRMTD